jgi:hypothetical protein
MGGCINFPGILLFLFKCRSTQARAEWLSVGVLVGVPSMSSRSPLSVSWDHTCETLPLYIISFYIYSFVSARFIIVITLFGVTLETNCRVLTHYT